MLKIIALLIAAFTLAGCGAGPGFGCPKNVPPPETGYCSYHTP